jgi:hypothetical protein
VGARLLSRPALLSTTLFLAAAALGCRGYHVESARARAEQLSLEHQVARLRAATALADEGPLLPPGALVLALDEALLRDLFAAALPVEQVLQERCKLRLERAEASLAPGAGTITLFGRAGDVSAPEAFVDVVLQGALEAPTLDAERGVLVAGVTLDQVATLPADATSGAAVLVEQLAREHLDAFGAVVPRVEIPVRLQPLPVAVARAFATRERWWVLLDVSTAAGTARAAPARAR